MLIILATARTGSTWLYELLCEKPKKSILFEPFNSPEGREPFKEFLDDDRTKNRMDDPASYLDMLFDSTSGEHLACKIILEHLKAETIEKLCKGPYSFLVLKRRDRLKQYLSWYATEATGWYIVYDPANGIPPINSRIIIDHARERMDWIEAKYEMAFSILANHNMVNFALMYYEDFIGKPNKVRLTFNLNARPDAVLPIKQAVDYEWVLNKGELRQRLQKYGTI